MSFTITERSPGQFAVRIRRGKLQPFYFSVGSKAQPASRAEAETAARRWLRQSDLRPLDPNCTLGDWLRHLVSSAHDLAPRSIATYRTHLDAWIDHANPGQFSLGAIRLRELTAADGGAFIPWLADGCGCATPYGPCRHKGGYRPPHKMRTVRDAVVFVRAGLDQAVSLGMLDRNPWAHVKLPRAIRRPPATPGRADLSRLAECPQPRVRLLLVLAAYTGARRSELLGLTWENIDLKGGTLTIGASLDQQRGQLPALKEPKTASGRRTIALPALALAALRLARLAAPATGRRIEAVPVFANDDGSWWAPEAASQAALRALRALGLPGSLHTLRHAHATLLLGGEGGVSAHVVSRRLGHSSLATTLSLYAHAVPADDKAAAEAIDRLFARQPGATGTR